MRSAHECACSLHTCSFLFWGSVLILADLKGVAWESRYWFRRGEGISFDLPGSSTPHPPRPAVSWVLWSLERAVDWCEWLDRRVGGGHEWGLCCLGSSGAGVCVQVYLPSVISLAQQDDQEDISPSLAEQHWDKKLPEPLSWRSDEEDEDSDFGEEQRDCYLKVLGWRILVDSAVMSFSLCATSYEALISLDSGDLFIFKAPANQLWCFLPSKDTQVVYKINTLNCSVWI